MARIDRFIEERFNESLIKAPDKTIVLSKLDLSSYRQILPEVNLNKKIRIRYTYIVVIILCICISGFTFYKIGFHQKANEETYKTVLDSYEESIIDNKCAISNTKAIYSFVIDSVNIYIFRGYTKQSDDKIEVTYFYKIIDNNDNEIIITDSKRKEIDDLDSYRFGLLFEKNYMKDEEEILEFYVKINGNEKHYILKN